MKYPIADLSDRYTIEVLKNERANATNEQQLKVLFEEIELSKDYLQTIQEVKDFDACLKNLYQLNGSIWDLESDIRKGKEGSLGLEEVGRRALAIRDLNGMRILQKNKIASLFGEMYEKKYNHASA